MGYINDVEQGLRVLLTNTRPDDQEAIVRYCKDKILESYRNGVDAGTNGATNTPVAPKAARQQPRTFTHRR